MENGDELIGKPVQLHNDTIFIRIINKKNHVAASAAKNTYQGKFEFPNVYHSGYFCGPYPIPFKKKKNYLHNTFGAIKSVHYGITKNLSIGAGFVLDLISKEIGTWFFTSKVGFAISQKNHLVGGRLIRGVEFDETVVSKWYFY